jgi:hypothetical protein
MKLGNGLKVVSSLEAAWDGPLPPELVSDEDAEQEAAEPGYLAKAHAAIWRMGGAPMVFTGVDLGVQRKDSNDETSLFTIKLEAGGLRRVLRIESGRWTGPEILHRVEQTFLAFGSIFIVENNAAQQYIIDFTKESELVIPVIPFTTGRNKAHPEFGVESVGAEMANGKWLIPNTNGRTDDEVSEWITELLFYDPREHVGDRVMASWFAREGARRFADFGRRNSGKVRVRSI